VRLGLVLCRGKFAYQPDAFGWWLPFAIQRRVVKLWNPLACRVMGHNWFDGKHDLEPGVLICMDCSKRRRAA